MYNLAVLKLCEGSFAYLDKNSEFKFYFIFLQCSINLHMHLFNPQHVEL